MTTKEVMHKGRCGETDIRTRQWKAGFSIKCLRIEKTIVGTPFIQRAFDSDLQSFCWDCNISEKEKVQLITQKHTKEPTK